MTTTTLRNNPQSSFSIRSLIQRGWSINRPLMTLILICLALTGLGIIAMIVDPRTLGGQIVWTKPTKFGISIAIYCSTILFLFGSIQPRPRWVNWVFNFTNATLAIEMLIIAVQAARGVTSHYNFTTQYDGYAWNVMGISILILSIVSFVGCVLLVRHALTFDGKRISRSIVWGLKLGMAVTVLGGFSVAILMTLPTESQLAGFEAGAEDAGSIIGAHTVGAEDGGPGLPVLGWSTTHGDLRPAHFFGLHALQIVPLFGLFVARRREQWLREPHRLGLIVIGGLAYAGFIALTAWQALQAEPLIYPSAETLTLLAALIGTTLIASGVTVMHARRSLN